MKPIAIVPAAAAAALAVTILAVSPDNPSAAPDSTASASTPMKMANAATRKALHRRNSEIAPGATRDVANDAQWFGMDLTHAPTRRGLTPIVEPVNPDQTPMHPGPMPRAPDLIPDAFVVKPFGGWDPVFYGPSSRGGRTLMLNHDAPTERDAQRRAEVLLERIKQRFGLRRDAGFLASEGGDPGFIIEFAERDGHDGRLWSPTLRHVALTREGRHVFMAVELRRGFDAPNGRRTSRGGALEV